MVELVNLAEEFALDSLSSKMDKTHAPVTMDSLQAARKAYLDAHPDARDFRFEASSTINPAPTAEEVSRGTYIHDRWRT